MKKLFLLILLSQGLQILAQLPVGDPTWTLSKQDDFNTFNSTDWCGDYCFGPVNNGAEYNSPSQLLFNSPNGYLTIKCEKLTTPINYNGEDYYYKSGAMASLFLFKYGYFEISAIMPKGRGYWPAFWGWRQGVPPSGIPPCTGPNDSWYNENDYLENNGTTSQYDQMGGGYVFRDPAVCGSTSLASNGHEISVAPAQITDEHKYAVFWEYDRLTWYFDDQPVYTEYDPVLIPHNAINTIFNFAIHRANWNDPPDASTTFPAYFKINYLKIWQLEEDCNTAEAFCLSAFNPSTYVSKVKKSISIGGSGCTSQSTISTSDNIHLWATDYILIDEGTTIDDGDSGSFSAQVTPCPN